MLTSASLGADALWHVVDQLALLKRFVAEMAAQWNGHLLDIVAAQDASAGRQCRWWGKPRGCGRVAAVAQLAAPVVGVHDIVNVGRHLHTGPPALPGH